MSESTKKWYVVRTAGGKEKKAKEYLEKEIQRRGLQDMVPQVLIPTEKVYTMRNGKRVATERMFYPGYILVECHMTGEIQHMIRNEIPNVAGFLTEGKGKDKEPMPLRESEVNRILGRVDEVSESDIETVTTFDIGEAVKIIDGPFSGFNATVDEIHADRRKLKVMVMIFGRKTLIELNFSQVTKE
ncbi:transcription termination/antitermination factor NusG [Muribaculum sp. An289]|jgi:transcriptional antiterminator NusG|uniref:Transcription termination/antitermination protein NusG n=1 Tax=Candidatus Merdivivens faecigallinarum TaxID=2840871 RepID=A0A9D9IXU9_9BACT|nr:MULTISPECIES: transcription termination/antitermination protein NusG [unclassified Muribaculum]MBO8481004.1 transcription termination/antitermination factor NusG [Candidatus Merdivivens faecigallinarum]OUO37707.1 transcription termination/antitermination factor NusG [Muribaculum sp. An289]OUO43753.1 transcription termination/antitermination factor NusG [Muribaculum sp. An287]